LTARLHITLLGSTSLTRANADSTSIAASAEFNSLFHDVISRLQTSAVALLNNSLPAHHNLQQDLPIKHLKQEQQTIQNII
jgi:hypothetical protein